MTKTPPAPERPVQAHSLMPLLVHPRHLTQAARRCMRTASSSGADGMTWHDYRVGCHDRLAHLAARLRDGTWRPGPVRQITWPSADKHLCVTIPTVEDRIVHRAIRGCIEPILEAHAYPDWMFGWRPGRGRIHALTHAQQRGITSPCWVADIDIAHATAGSTVEQAISWLAQWVHDGTFLATVRHALNGLPSPLAPGSGLSPLLTNLRLLRIDHALTDVTVVRVTDNYVIFCPDRLHADRAFDHLTEVLFAHALEPSAAKSKVWRPNLEDLFLAG
ncbi:MAG: reverse transcriptase domain-containing protein [Pseudonocardiaceae bacterium]